MNGNDRKWLSKIDGKLDKISECTVRTDQKLSDHLKDHDRKTKTRYFVIGTLITVATVTVNALINYFTKIFGGK